MKASPLPPLPTITPLLLIAFAWASASGPPVPGALRSVTVPLANSTACASPSEADTEAPTASPELLTASASDVMLPGSIPSDLIVPFCHSTATGSLVVVSASPTITPESLLPAGRPSTPPLGSSGSIVTVLPWTVNGFSPLLVPYPAIRLLSLIAVAFGLRREESPGRVPRLVGVLLFGHRSGVVMLLVEDWEDPATPSVALIPAGRAPE